MKFIFTVLFCLLSLPGFAQEDDDRLLNKLEEDRRRQQETALKLNEAQENLKNAAFNAPAELKKLGYETVNAAALMDEKVVRVVKRMMKESTLKQATHEQVKALMLEKSKGSSMEGFLKNNPKITNMFVDILRDDAALENLVNIFLRKSDLKLYACFWVGIMILAWLFKKIFFKKNWGRGKAFLMNILVSLAVTSISLTTFYNMFHDELSPTAKIMIKHWRKRNL